MNAPLTNAFSVGRLLSALMDRFTEKKDSLLVVTEGLSMSRVPSRMSLQDAYSMLTTHENNQELPVQKKTKSFAKNYGCSAIPLPPEATQSS